MLTVDEHFRAILAGNTFVDTPDLVLYRGAPLFSVRRADDGTLGISFMAFNKNGEQIATIRNGEITFGERDSFDLQASDDRWSLKEVASGRVICDIKKRPASQPTELEIAVDMHTRDGYHVEATADATTLPGTAISGSTFTGCRAGIAVLHGSVQFGVS